MATSSDQLVLGCQISLLFAIIAFAIICVYRLKFHPLAKYPGPTLAKLTDFYGVYYACQGRLMIQQFVLHKRYGSVVRSGPNRVIFSSPTALQNIYMNRSVRKHDGYAATHVVSGVSNTFDCIDKELHRRKRKAISPGFSEQSIKSFEYIILEEIDVFLQQLLQEIDNRACTQQGWSRSLNMSTLVKHFTLDVIGSFAFGRPFNVQTDPKNRGMIYRMQAGSMVAGVCAQYPALRKLNMHKFVNCKGAWSLEQYSNFTREMIEDRLNYASDAKADLYSFVLSAKNSNPGPGFSLQDLWAESRLLLLAGSDTSATTISAAFFYLSRYPACYDKLAAELRASFSTAGDIQLGPTLSGSQYLRAVIDECLRLSPPVGMALWREVLLDGILVDGEHLPPGTMVGSSLYAVLHSEENFPEASTFLPERWLKIGGKHQDALPKAKAAFKPFSIGPRACPGMNLAYAEITLLLARVVWTVDFRRSIGPEDRIGEGDPKGPEGTRDVNEYRIREYISMMHDGPYLQFRRAPHMT